MRSHKGAGSTSGSEQVAFAQTAFDHGLDHKVEDAIMRQANAAEYVTLEPNCTPWKAESILLASIVDTGKKATLPKSRLENIEGVLLMFSEDAPPTKLAQLRLFTR